jgi:hypothetical protein
MQGVLIDVYANDVGEKLKLFCLRFYSKTMVSDKRAQRILIKYDNCHLKGNSCTLKNY